MSRAVRRILTAGMLAGTAIWLFAGCSGKDGKDGVDGQDGAQGPTGPSGTAECMQCHTDDWSMEDYLLPIEAQFEESVHHMGETFLRKDAPCSGCHTTEGYQQRIATGTASSLAQSSKIGCFACHAPHTNRSFDLRQSDAVVVDVGNATFDKNNSNTCAMCHQARVPSPAIDSSTDITSSRWGPHHAAQANFIAGAGAYQFPGAATYPTNATHAGNLVPNGCVTCHMATIPSSLAGGHTFDVGYSTESGSSSINSAPCTGCHTGWTDATAQTHVTTLRTAFEAGVDSVKTLLIDRGWVNPSSGLINASSQAPLTGLSTDDRGALFNYYLLDTDRASGGVHNIAYENAVLQATIDYLNE